MTQFILDHAKFDGHYSGVQHQCEVCGEWTDRCVQLGWPAETIYTLCEAHANQETLVELVDSVGDIVASW